MTDKRTSITKISDDGKKALNKALKDASVIDQADDVFKLANCSNTEEFNDSMTENKGEEALRRNDDIIFESLRLSNGWQKQYLFSLTKIRNLTSKNEILEDAIKSITGMFVQLLFRVFVCLCWCGRCGFVLCCLWCCLEWGAVWPLGRWFSPSRCFSGSRLGLVAVFGVGVW